MPIQKKDFSKQIMGYALKNSIDYGGAEPGKILPKLFQHGLTKEQIPEIIPQIQKAVEEANALSQEDRILAFKEYIKHIKFYEEKERSLPPLPNPSKKMVFRLAPYPSGALHLGHAKTYLLNAIYAEHYKAKTLFIMDDTIGSDEKHLIPDGYNLVKESFELLGIKYEKPIIYKSDRLELYYKYAEELIKKSHAYVCHCTQEQVKANRAKGIACSCREFPPDIQLLRWKDMFKLEKGEATLRLKTDMLHKNPAFRDRVLFKISDREHPRTGRKYKVWPSLEMSWAIDDHELGITHIIRGNDLMIETQVEKFIWDIFKWKHPETIHTGMIKIVGMEAKISKSKAQKEIETGKFTGWDDPRTWSIQSLLRRGITKKAIREFVEEIGLNKQDITIPIETLYSINRKIIDAKASRYFFVENPIQLTFQAKLPLTTATLPMHPDTPNQTRKVKLGTILISKNDFEKYKNQEVRLLHLFNVEFDSSGKTEIISLENKDIPKIQWVSDSIPVKILMSDGNWILGKAESAVKNLKPNELIQFERFGFVKFDAKTKDTHDFWFSHK